jgi:SAM-dependent methyltransferase
MEIPLPPDSGTGLEKIVVSSIRELNNYFGSEGSKEGAEWGFEKKSFEDYFSQFEWFEHAVPRAEMILNIGCSYGRETFALLWFFGAAQAVGIDICPKRIDFVHRRPILSLKSLAQFISRFNKSPAGFGWTEHYIREFQAWWRTKVPDDLRRCVESGVIPEFIEGDISERKSIPQSDDHFDLVYCCNVLDELVNEGKDWHSAIQNIAAVVKPETGRVVVVGATERDATQTKHSSNFLSLDDLRPHFREVELKLLEIKDAPCLGYLDWPATKPRGYVYGRQ